MKARSNAVARLGKDRCDLCGKPGTTKNSLTRHHADGDNKNNDAENHMVLHRILCHTFGDFITQFYARYGVAATPVLIKRAWVSFTWSSSGMLVRPSEE